MDGVHNHFDCYDHQSTCGAEKSETAKGCIKRSQMKASLGVSEKGCTPKVEVSMTVARVRSWHGCNTLETKWQQSKGAKNKQKRERERIENNTGKWPFHQTRANHWDSTKFRTIQWLQWTTLQIPLSHWGLSSFAEAEILWQKFIMMKIHLLNVLWI